jgi:hypothetical protein
MARQEQGAAGGPPGREPAITQAERGAWQRQAVALLEHLVMRNAGLPAINWLLTRAGNLHGRVGSRVPPGQARTVFTAWSVALGLDGHDELPGMDGASMLVHGCARWGSVEVSMSASVQPPGSGGEEPDVAGEPGVPSARTLFPAVEFLGKTLRCHQDTDAVTWLVRASGELSAQVCVPGSPQQTAALFRRWQQALLPFEPQPTAFHDGTRTGLRAEGPCSDNVRVTLEAIVVRTRSHHGTAGAEAPEPGPGGAPGPGSGTGRRERPGAVTEHRAARLLQPVPMHCGERPGPTPRPP